MMIDKHLMDERDWVELVDLRDGTKERIPGFGRTVQEARKTAFVFASKEAECRNKAEAFCRFVAVPWFLSVQRKEPKPIKVDNAKREKLRTHKGENDDAE